MKKIALIGDSISHSLSPQLFKVAYKHLSSEIIDNSFTYNLLDFPTLNEAMEVFENDGYYGANITSPYKEEIFAYCNQLDKTAQESGAINLILKQNNGIKGFNTDCEGVYTPLSKRNIKPSNVIIVGAGGAAKAAIYALKKRGYNITIVNRSDSKAQKLSQKHSTQWASMSRLPQLLKENKIIVYTIEANIESLKEANLEDITLFEANYKTPSLNRKSCKEYIPGTEWLIYQAVPSFRLFTDKEPNIYAMLKLVNSH